MKYSEFITALRKIVLICVPALILWHPLIVYGEIANGISIIHVLIGLGVIAFITDYDNFKNETRIRYYVFAILLCPFWIVIRNWIMKKDF